MSKKRKRFRTESKRSKNGNYISHWWYYVTIYTNKHKTHFGGVLNEEMMLNSYGKVADNCWKAIPEHYKNAELDGYIVMPNQVHGIIVINEPIHKTTDTTALRRQNKHKLAEIVGEYKAAVTRIIRKSGFEEFKWQSRFHDRVIRNDKELFNIRKTIKQNPVQWENEKSTPIYLDY